MSKFNLLFQNSFCHFVFRNLKNEDALMKEIDIGLANAVARLPREPNPDDREMSVKRMLSIESL